MVTLESGWEKALKTEWESPYFKNIRAFLVQEIESGKTIYPPLPKIFSAFNATPFDSVKVVILGQDPYHGPHQAHGMAFSVNKGVRTPPSLQNIYKELHKDCGFSVPNHGFLEPWAQQGVLLLNASLTVEEGQPNSHALCGWGTFTDQVIRTLSSEKENLVFCLWGKFAQSKEALIDTSKHLVLKAAHPSPFSAHNGFFGCQHFSKINTSLKSQGLQPIDWNLHASLKY